MAYGPDREHDYYPQEKVNPPRDLLSENDKRVGFNEPAAAFVDDEGAGPFRSSAAVLRRVEFDPRKLSRGDRKFISSLPKRIAIIGGFARGMYLGDMRGVGDIDLATYISKEMMENWDRNPHLEALSDFIERWGYKVGYDRGGYGGFVRILSISGRPCTGGPGILSWNSRPLGTRRFWSPKRKVDVLASPSQELSDFLNLFDISICQFAYLNGYLYATEAALEDVAQNKFHVLRATEPERARKYMHKGYKLIWDEVAAKVLGLLAFDAEFAEAIRRIT